MTDPEGGTEVLVCGARFDPLDIEERVLAPVGARLRRAPGDDARALIESGAEATAVLAGSAPRFPREVLAALPRLKLLVRYGIGVDRIDLDAAEELGIQVCNVTDYCTDEVATHAVMLLLAATRKLPAALATTGDGGWGIGRVQPIDEPASTVAAVLGLGRIGRGVARRLRDLGFQVRAYDPYVGDEDVRALGVAPSASMREALADAHAVSLHLPLTDATRHILSEAEFGLMREGGVVVNVSRGGLIDEAALTGALDDGRLSYAALDVLEEEPPPEEHPLPKHPRVLVTPHMAWYSLQAQARMRQQAAEEVARFVAGRPLANPLVSPEAPR